MSRSILASALTVLVLAVVPGTALAKNNNSDGNTKRDREATALWPSERPYHVDMGPCSSRVPVLIRNPGPGPARIWVVNINCDPPGPDRHWFW